VHQDAQTDALVAELRAVIADLRRDRDEWREQAQRLALPAPKPAEQPPTTAWQRFLRWRRFTVVMNHMTVGAGLGAILYSIMHWKEHGNSIGLTFRAAVTR